MSKQVATKDVVSDLEDIHRGIHAVLDALERQNDPRRAAEILHQVDQISTNLLRNIKTAKLG